MAGSVVPYHIRRLRQCVFFFGSCDPVWQIWKRSNPGWLGKTLGLGEDEGMAFLYKDVWDLFDKLSLSRRRYYYLRENAFMLMSLILWAGPTSEISRWLEIIAMLEEMKMD